MISEANREPDLERRAQLFKHAETILIAEEVPIVPIYFYSGFSCYNDQKIKGIYPNLLDEHPLQDIWKQPADSRLRQASSAAGTWLRRYWFCQSQARGPFF
jgi:ABC-type oligopeptide transport system substrate-binding subunit